MPMTKKLVWLVLVLLSVVVRTESRAQDKSAPGGDEVTVAMKKAMSFYRIRLSFGGGCASRWSQDPAGRIAYSTLDDNKT